MPDRPTTIALGFSVADAERPILELKGHSLTICFPDWRGQTVVVAFDDTIAVRWQEAEYFFTTEERFDSTYVVEDSTWLDEHDKQAMTWTGSGHRHLKLNFNAAGVLEVLCTSVHVSTVSLSEKDP